MAPPLNFVLSNSLLTLTLLQTVIVTCVTLLLLLSSGDTTVVRLHESACHKLTINVSLSSAKSRASCTCSDAFAEIKCRHMVDIPRFNSSFVFNAVHLSRQSITSLPVRSFVDLRVRRIILNFNDLGDRVDSGSLIGLESDLQELHLGGCRISKLPDTGLFDGLQRLSVLHLWKNEIVALPPRVFANCCRELNELLLWGNVIESIDPESFTGLTSLRKLDLDNNQISTLSRDAFKELSALEVLHLSGNSITTLAAETFSSLSNSLRVLSLNSNGLEFIYGRAFDGLSRLVSLSLDNNRMTFLPGDAFVGMNNLSILILGHSNLRSVFSRVFAGLRSLERLDLSFNELSHLPDGSLRDSSRLRHVDLSNNRLTSLSGCVMSRSARVRTFSLAGNTGLQCDCRLAWAVEMHDIVGTAVTGTCVTGGSYAASVSSPTSFASRRHYRVSGCSSVSATGADCKQSMPHGYRRRSTRHMKGRHR